MTAAKRASARKPARKKPAPRKKRAPKKLLGSMFELEKLPGMPSAPTLRKLIEENPEFPLLKRGKNGVAYEMDLGAAHKFVMALQEAEEAEARSRDAKVRQFGLDLVGPGAEIAREDQADLTAKERREILEQELVATKLAEKRGELVRKVDIEQAVGAFVVKTKTLGDTFSARLGKKIDIDRDMIAALDSLVEADQRSLAAFMESLPNVGNKSD